MFQRLFTFSRNKLAYFSSTAVLLLCLGSLYAGSIYFAGNLPILSLCFVIGTALAGGWLVKRGIVDKKNLPKTRIEIWLVFFLFSALLSVLFSAYPRIGLERLGWYLLLSILFYGFLDLMEQLRYRQSIQQVLLFFTGLAIFLALLETYFHYLIWWNLAGSKNILPPHPYRFASVVVQSNIFMGLVNMCAPFALILFFMSKRRVGRVLGALWLVMYLGAAAFSSSRGGWLGAAGWMSVFIVLWLIDGGRWLKLISWLKKRWQISMALGVAGLSACAYVAVKAYRIIVIANPTHGGGGGLNREWIWDIAVKIWKSSPWTGSGLGKLGLDYLSITQGMVKPWWPGHAHSLPLQILSEMGLIGFLFFIVLSACIAVLLISCYRRTPASERLTSAAALAGLAGLFVHGFFETFIFLPLIVAVALSLIALVITAAGPLPRFRQLPLTWLSAPAVLVGAIAFFSLWSYAPLYKATSTATVTGWRQAAEMAEQSTLRDPAMAYYQFQSGIAWAMVWHQTGDIQALEQARAYFSRGLELDPSSSINWADLSVLNWYVGRQDESLKYIQRAAEMSPFEPSFPLNWGWFLEQIGRKEEAAQQYRHVLQIAPWSAAHPFWQNTSLRKEVVSEIQTPPETEYAFWQQAQKKISSGDFASARIDLAKSYYFWEQPSGFAISWAKYEEKIGNLDNAWLYLEDSVNVLDNSYWNYAIGEFSYSAYVARNDFSHTLVPGYLQITRDFGQFQALEDLYQKQLNESECLSTLHTWETLQREIYAGELLSGGYPKARQCP